jgi:hypothetical protein
MKHWSKKLPYLSIQFLPPAFRYEHHMILAIPSRMTYTFVRHFVASFGLYRQAFPFTQRRILLQLNLNVKH